MNIMKAMTRVFIYLLSFFAVGWACGYNPLEVHEIFSALLYDPGANDFEIHQLPKGGGLSPVLLLWLVYVLGVFISCFIESRKIRMDLLIFRKNIFIGLICISVLSVFFQLKGRVRFLETYIRVDKANWTVREKLGESLDFATRLARRVHRHYSGQPVTLSIDMEEECGKDPCFYIERALKYYLYPVDSGDIRNEAARGVLRPFSRFSSN